MEEQKRKIEQHHSIENYAVWLVGALKQQGICLSVVGENSLHVKGELTSAQKETVRLWKQNLINALLPKCVNCTLPMRLIENNTLWLCPFGCQSLEVEKV